MASPGSQSIVCLTQPICAMFCNTNSSWPDVCYETSAKTLVESQNSIHAGVHISHVIMFALLSSSKTGNIHHWSDTVC